MRRLHVAAASLASLTLAVRPPAAPAQAAQAAPNAPAARGASAPAAAARPDTARFPAGRYRMSVTKAELPPVLAEFAGDWELRFGADGRFEVFYLTTTRPQLIDRGGYYVDGRRLTVIDDPDAPRSCGRVEAVAGTGVYTWEARGAQLVLRPVDDPCMGRRHGMSGKPLTRAPEEPAAPAPPR